MAGNFVKGGCDSCVRYNMQCEQLSMTMHKTKRLAGANLEISNIDRYWN